jgi:TonB family protein
METIAIPNVIAFIAQVCVIVLAAALLLRLLHIASPGTRYFCWRLVLVVCLAMPLLLQRTATPPVIETPDAAMSVDVLAPSPSDALGLTPSSPVSRRTPFPWALIAAAIIVVGALARAAWLVVGLVRLGALRRHGVPIEDVDYAEIQALLGTHASLRSVDGLTQPATFGVWRPVVLLPHTLTTAPLALRRAVVTHELFHVQRRDWCWVLVEEMLRAALWFHPAILWVTSRIQLAREELVDELTVLATGNRKAYIEALLAFADAGHVRPAPAFARRRHLFARILRLSKEKVMSAPRIVMSAAIVIAAVLGTGWYASTVFPILAAAQAVQPATVEPRGELPTPPAAQTSSEWTEYLRATQESLRTIAASQGPRSGGAPRPGPVTATAVPAAAGTKAITPENPIPRRLTSSAAAYPAQLRGSGYRGVVTVRVTLDASGRISDVLRLSVEAIGDSTAVDRSTAATAFFDATADAVRQWRYQSPADPPISFFVNVRFDGERDAVAAQSEAPLVGGVRFVAVNVNNARGDLAGFEERLKLLRDQRDRLQVQYNAAHPDVVRLNGQILDMERELERARNTYTAALRVEQDATAGGRVAGPGSTSPRPVAVAGVEGRRVAGPGTTAGQPVRVGGNIKPPTKITHVDPVYPEIAKSARVQGVVIMEATIDEQGRVAEARVLRSIPLLDQAALDAIRQWEFTPTLLNGAPVPVIMTMTVQFTLPQPPPQ